MKKQYKFLTTGALMVMLLTGVMPRAMAQDLNGTETGRLAEVHDGDRYDLVYGVAEGTHDPTQWGSDDALAENGTVIMDGGSVFNVYGGSAHAKSSVKSTSAANNNFVDISNGTISMVVYGGQAYDYNAEAVNNTVNISGGSIGVEA